MRRVAALLAVLVVLLYVPCVAMAQDLPLPQPEQPPSIDSVKPWYVGMFNHGFSGTELLGEAIGKAPEYGAGTWKFSMDFRDLELGPSTKGGAFIVRAIDERRLMFAVFPSEILLGEAANIITSGEKQEVEESLVDNGLAVSADLANWLQAISRAHTPNDADNVGGNAWFLVSCETKGRMATIILKDRPEARSGLKFWVHCFRRSRTLPDGSQQVRQVAEVVGFAPWES